MLSLLYHSETNFEYPDETLHPRHIDPNKLLRARMALTHDVCKALAGRHLLLTVATLMIGTAREEAAMQHIMATLGNSLGKDLYEYWKEYEEQETNTAIIVKDLDKFEMLVQALEYEKAHLQPCPQNADKLLDTKTSAMAIANEPLRDFFQRQAGSVSDAAVSVVGWRTAKSPQEALVGTRVGHYKWQSLKMGKAGKQAP